MPADPFAGPIVVDANVLFSALLKDGTTRCLILHPKFDLHTPEYLWEELGRNRRFLLGKSGATEAAFELLVDSMKQRIRNIPLDVIRPHMKEASRRLGRTTDLDTAYVAAALAIDGAIWTHDKPLAHKARVATLRTVEMLRRMYD